MTYVHIFRAGLCVDDWYLSVHEWKRLLKSWGSPPSITLVSGVWAGYSGKHKMKWHGYVIWENYIHIWESYGNYPENLSLIRSAIVKISSPLFVSVSFLSFFRAWRTKGKLECWSCRIEVQLPQIDLFTIVIMQTET